MTYLTTDGVAAHCDDVPDSHGPEGSGVESSGRAEEAGPSAVRLEWIDVESIRENPRQPRQQFDDDALDELAGSIAAVGLLQPLVVRPCAVPVDDDGGGGTTWELVAGERRLRSVRRLGWVTVPALVRDTADGHLLRDALVENLQRAQLNPLEEGAAYNQLLTDFGCTHDELAARVGRSRPHISNTLRLLRLPASVQRRVAAGVLSQGHARALLALQDADSMERLAGRIVAEGLSVRSVEEIVALRGQGVDAPTTKPRSRTARRIELSEAATSLSDRLDTRVSVTMGRAKGRVTIEFAGHEDLDRILALIVGETST